MQIDSPFLHFFKANIRTIESPKLFTYPFCYDPHELGIIAAKEVQEYLIQQKDFDHNFGLTKDQNGLVIGKMFGVLVVKDRHNNLGFIAACSGKLAGTNRHKYFVPPVFDMLDDNSFYLKEEKKINKLNETIELLTRNPRIETLNQLLIKVKNESNQLLANKRLENKTNKVNRKEVRAKTKASVTINEYQRIEEDLIKQSHRDQHEYDVLKRECNAKIDKVEKELQKLTKEIENVKDERRALSSSLQQKLFEQYQFLNALGQTKSLVTIFQNALQIQPPAGAGECAAPKLLQHAYLHGLQPVCMAEFWWGEAPPSEVRKHGYFYPACRGKCEPILNHMLQGLNLEPNPMDTAPADHLELEVIYEDKEIIVVNKPVEFLSVPGKKIQDSVQTRIQNRYLDITGPIIIHRLDMSTSGIIVIARNKESHQFIQNQFINHHVQKRYTALLDGIITKEEGVIELPLRVDLNDRPRQVVCYEYGKPAKTRYLVKGVENDRTRIHFFPITGRTHQLRVHAAHCKGLNTPILGDDLYGKREQRLYLHAGYIRFIHPTTKQEIEFEIPDPF